MDKPDNPKRSQNIPNFNITRHAGKWTEAFLPDGTKVDKLEKIFSIEHGGFIPCAPYDDHFIYEIPSKLAAMYPGSVYRCTCGGAAVIVGNSGYLLDASPQGKMMVCLIHATLGIHATGGQRWI